MSRCIHKLQSILVAGALCWPAISSAQTIVAKEAVVVSSFGLSADPVSRDVRSDALAVSESLLGLGYNVRRFENPDPDVLKTALAAADGDDLVVYYVGTEAALLPELSETLASVTYASAAIFLDVCRAELALTVSQTGAWTLPDSLPADAFFAAAIPPGASCGVPVGPVAANLLEGLTVPGLSLDLAFAASENEDAPVWTTSTLSAPLILRQPESDMRLTSKDYALLESLPEDAQAQMIALWTEAGIAVDRAAHDVDMVSFAPVSAVVEDNIVVTAPVRPLRSNAAIVQPRGANAPVEDGISVIAAAPVQSSANRAVPGVGGLPSPSIIVGLIAQEASFGTVIEDDGFGTVIEDGGFGAVIEGGEVLSGSEFDYTNLVARRALRDDDPDLFASLIDAGAFDPSPAELVFALQSELTRMECYDRGIDGQWGGGSEAGLRRFYEELDETPENLDPTLASFHKMLLRDDVTCPPVVVAAAPRPAATTTSTPSRQQATAPAAPRQQAAAPAAPRRQAAPAAPAAQPSRTINQNSGVTGVFR